MSMVFFGVILMQKKEQPLIMLDLQICTDIFAVVTYITDYCSKDETGILELLIKEWKKSGNEEFKKRCHQMKDVFLTHQKMGEVEAYYRILPSLHLVESNIKCLFVTSGFPESRSKFLVKITEEESLSNPADIDFVHVENRQGNYKESRSVHIHYAARPDYVEDVCLAQFTTFYSTSYNQKLTKEECEEKMQPNNRPTYAMRLEIRCPNTYLWVRQMAKIAS